MSLTSIGGWYHLAFHAVGIYPASLKRAEATKFFTTKKFSADAL